MIPFKIKVIFFIVLVCSFFLLIYWRSQAERLTERELKESLYFPVHLNKRLVDISFEGVDEKILTNKSISEGIYFLHFWATWCKSCEEELKSISDLNGDNFKFLCISVDEKPEDAIQYIRQRGLNINLFFDKGGESAKALGTTKFPETYIVKNNRIVLKFEGPRDWNDKEFIDFINEYLKKY